MHSSANVQSPPLSAVFICVCDKVSHKQEAGFLLFLLGQIVNITLIHWIKIDRVL